MPINRQPPLCAAPAVRVLHESADLVGRIAAQLSPAELAQAAGTNRLFAAAAKDLQVWQAFNYRTNPHVRPIDTASLMRLQCPPVLTALRTATDVTLSLGGEPLCLVLALGATLIARGAKFLHVEVVQAAFGHTADTCLDDAWRDRWLIPLRWRDARRADARDARLDAAKMASKLALDLLHSGVANAELPPERRRTLQAYAGLLDRQQQHLLAALPKQLLRHRWQLERWRQIGRTDANRSRLGTSRLAVMHLDRRIRPLLAPKPLRTPGPKTLFNFSATCATASSCMGYDSSCVCQTEGIITHCNC